MGAISLLNHLFAKLLKAPGPPCWGGDAAALPVPHLSLLLCITTTSRVSQTSPSSPHYLWVVPLLLLANPAAFWMFVLLESCLSPSCWTPLRGKTGCVKPLLKLLPPDLSGLDSADHLKPSVTRAAGSPLQPGAFCSCSAKLSVLSLVFPWCLILLLLLLCPLISSLADSYSSFKTTSVALSSVPLHSHRVCSHNSLSLAHC